VGTRFPAHVQTDAGAHPASFRMGTGSFLGVKLPGRGVDHPPPSSAEIEGSEELYICPLWAFVACYMVNFTFIYEVTSAVQIFWRNVTSPSSG